MIQLTLRMNNLQLGLFKYEKTEKNLTHMTQIFKWLSALNLLLYKLFGESRNAHQERQDLAHAISLMTELGEAKRRNAESEPDEDAKWSITFDQIKEFFRKF